MSALSKVDLQQDPGGVVDKEISAGQTERAEGNIDPRHAQLLQRVLRGGGAAVLLVLGPELAKPKHRS
jgi:hypothetical protein